jgi:hypothetical protein
MTTAVKSQPKTQTKKQQPTRRQNAEILLGQYLQAKKAKEAAAADMKTLEDQLHQWALDNRYEFQGSQTLSLDGGKLCFVNQSKLEVAKKFDGSLFAVEFPQAVDIKPKISAIKSLLISSDADRVRKLGVDVSTEETFSVKVA